jgi:hypothetical protein
MIYNAQGGVYQGAYGPGNTPDVLFKYDKDKAGYLLWRTRGIAKLMHMIKKRFGKRAVTSWEPTWFEIGELDHRFNVTTDQTNGKVVVMTNDQAAQLQTNDLLVADGLFLADGYEGGTVGEYSRRYDVQHRMEETMMVEREPIMNSHATGLAEVYVRRGHVGDATTGRLIAEPTPTGDGLLREGDVLLKISNAQWTGSDAPRGKSKNIEADNNYVQIFRYAYEVQTEYNYEQTYLKEDQMDINRKLALNAMVYEMEYRSLYGRKSKEAQGEYLRYTTGGLFDFIKNEVDYSQGGNVTTYTWRNWQRAINDVFEVGGSGSRVAYLAPIQFNELITMLWDKVRITLNEKWSKEFEFEIYTVRTGAGSINFVPSWVYAQNRFRSSQMLLLDFGNPNFKIDVLRDLQHETDLQLPGQKLKKNGYYAALGMQRRGPYHSILTGLPQITNA